MDKNQSNFLKGIVLLMMLLVHTDFTELYNPVSFDGKPVLAHLYMAYTPVALFMVLSGYGFYFKYRSGKDKNWFYRIFKLLLHFWIILAITIPIKAGIKDLQFSFSEVICNITAWHISWNASCWFILPYTIFALTYFKIIRLFERFGYTKMLLIVFIIHLVTGGLISYFQVQYDTSLPIVWNSLYIGHLLFPFVGGICINHFNMIENLKDKYPILVMWWGGISYSSCCPKNCYSHFCY